MNEEVIVKKNKIKLLLKELNLDAIYIKRQDNFSWLTGGKLNLVAIASDIGAVGLLITNEKDYAICNKIESPRILIEEQIENQGYIIETFEWFNDEELKIIQKIVKKGKLGADFNYPDSINILNRIIPLRYSLTSWELVRYKKLCSLATIAVEETAKQIRPGDKECSVVGKIANRLWENRIDYAAVFCGADERILLYRHPIASEKKIEKRLLICINARKNGLIASFTRFVQFGKLSEEIKDLYKLTVLIDCTMTANTIPGRPVVEVFKKALEMYKEAGFTDEYKFLHQGGALGYQGRDYRVNFNSNEIIQENQPFAWNPTITGAKSEDTMLATKEGPVILTKSSLYPLIEMKVGSYTFYKPDILVL